MQHPEKSGSGVSINVGGGITVTLPESKSRYRECEDRCNHGDHRHTTFALFPIATRGAALTASRARRPLRRRRPALSQVATLQTAAISEPKVGRRKKSGTGSSSIFLRCSAQ